MALDSYWQIVFPNCVPTYDATSSEWEAQAEGLRIISQHNIPKVDQLPHKVIKIQNISAQYRVSKSE